MFYDLNIQSLNQPTMNFVEEILTQLFEHGYRGVALTTEVDDSVFQNKKEKTKKKMVETDPVPPSVDVKKYSDWFPKLNIYTRINIIVRETDNIRRMQQSRNLKQYDIISFQPENQTVFKALVTFGNFDIISYNPEIYVPALTSQSARRNLISLSHVYHAVGKSQNIIVSSGAHLSKHVRGPYDVMNFNLLFGLSEEQAKKAISRNCDKLLAKAKKQRSGKCIVEMISADEEDTKIENANIT